MSRASAASPVRSTGSRVTMRHRTVATSVVPRTCEVDAANAVSEDPLVLSRRLNRLKYRLTPSATT
jgi:hypothetical protein